MVKKLFHIIIFFKEFFGKIIFRRRFKPMPKNIILLKNFYSLDSGAN